MLIWIIAAFLAYFVKGLCGFANTIVFTSVLSFNTDNINISPVDLLIGYPSNAIITFKERKKIQWNIALPLSAMVVLFSIPGAFFLKGMDSHIIKVLFGFVIIFIGADLFYRELKSKKSEMNKVLVVVIGILSGILCGLYGVGALLTTYINRVTDDVAAFKANFCFINFVENTFRLIVYICTGIFTAGSLRTGAILFPVMLASLFLGSLIEKKLNEKLAKKVVIILIIISGIALIISNI